MTTMKAAVVHQPGGPEVLKIESRPIPSPQPGQVLIQVKAFGVNRSELFTRQGLSPNVKFPRVLGIEAVGVVEHAPGGEFKSGSTVATVRGGMGRDFDGAYAEYTCVPAQQVRAVQTTLPWEKLGALPEMLQTSWGSLYTALQLSAGERLLIRGGTTSVGLAAASIAKSQGVRVVATTRSRDRIGMLEENGASSALIDEGSIAPSLRQEFPDGVDKVLELIGTTTLQDSLRCVRKQGIVCMTGIVGNKWTIDNFAPMEAIPTATYLTSYAGESEDFMRMPFQDLVDRVHEGVLRAPATRVFRLDQIVEAHRMMEQNSAGGKIVVLP